jgi:flagellar biosynthesis anti-sigma factor FlgM
MRIDLNPGIGVEGAQSAKTETQHANASDRAFRSESGAVEFETSIGKLAASALNSPEVRQGKVEALKAQVDAGTYQVSSHSVAGTLLDQLRRT